HEDEPFCVGLAQEGRRTRPDDLPASAGCEAAPVGPNRGDSWPPVRQVVGLGEKAPDVRAGGEELSRRLDPHRTPCRTLGTAPPPLGPRCACPGRVPLPRGPPFWLVWPGGGGPGFQGPGRGRGGGG